jgi:hypothetical protein
MKPRFVDPFTPNRPIDDPARFLGRVESVSELVDSLYQIMNKNPKHTLQHYYPELHLDLLHIESAFPSRFDGTSFFMRKVLCLESVSVICTCYDG